jgi:hypothetical protein
VISNTARWCLWQSQSSVMNKSSLYYPKNSFACQPMWLVKCITCHAFCRCFVQWFFLFSCAHAKNYWWAVTRSLLWAPFCCVYYNKVIKDFMIVLLAKDRYDFYQVCKILYLMDFLPWILWRVLLFLCSMSRGFLCAIRPWFETFLLQVTIK